MVKPYDFEKIIGSLYEKLGYTVLVCQATRDKGVDLFVKKYLPEYNRYELFVIQAKRWKRKVGIEEVQRLSGVITSRNADAGILVVTSDFSSDATTEAMTLKNVELVNRKKLEGKLAQAGIIDFEEIDLADDENSEFAQINKLLRILRKSCRSSIDFHELLRALKDIPYNIDENGLSTILSMLVSTNRIIFQKNEVVYIPSSTEKAMMEKRINDEILSLQFPFDLEFLFNKIPLLLNLSPVITNRVFDIHRITSQLKASRQIVELAAGFFATSNYLQAIELKLEESGYDILDFTDEKFRNSIKDEKKQNSEVFISAREANEHVSKALRTLSLYFDKKFIKQSLFVLPDFEKFIWVNDQKLLTVIETLLTVPEENGIDLEKGLSLVKCNLPLSCQVFGRIILEICNKHHTHVSGDKLVTSEKE